MTVAQMRRAARYFAISSKKSLCALKKNDIRGTKVIDVEAGVDAVLDILDSIAKSECELLRSGRARFTDVIAADGNGVPARHTGARSRTGTRQ